MASLPTLVLGQQLKGTDKTGIQSRKQDPPNLPAQHHTSYVQIIHSISSEICGETTDNDIS